MKEITIEVKSLAEINIGRDDTKSLRIPITFRKTELPHNTFLEKYNSGKHLTSFHRKISTNIY